MTQFDFTTRPDRLGQGSAKWHKSETDPGLLQLWIADMDFLPLPSVRQALVTYAQEHVFGYPHPSEGLYQSIIEWEKAEHGYEIAQEDILLIEGAVPSLSVSIQAFTEEGDAVLINTPVYPPFARSVQLNNRQLISNSLVIREGRFEIDFDQLEKDIVENQVKLYILCNPHNPGGRVWSKEDLLQIGQLCQRHGVVVVSDEIHQDLVLFGHKHHSFNTVSPDFKNFTIVLASASKTFNIAGTKNSFAIIQHEDLRKKFYKRQLANNQHEVPTVGLIATEVALRTGKPWLEELKQVLEENIETAISYLEEHTQIRAMKPEGTYLIWLDFSAYDMSHEEIQRKLLEEARVQLNDGLVFGKEGRYKARFNIAAPLSVVQEACERIARVFGKE